MDWTFATATKIRFGRDTSNTLASDIQSFGRKALIVTGGSPDRFPTLIQKLSDAELALDFQTCASEPSLEWLETAIVPARAFSPDVIIGLGGGSAIDAAKALAALIPNTGDPKSYLEVVGDGSELSKPPLPMIAVPTTSGTGAEVTKNAVISVTKDRRKVSLRDNRMLPDLAIVDPALTLGLPVEITAATGLDALTQVIEPYLSSKSNPLTDTICQSGISRAAAALPKLLQGADNIALREDMSLASVFGGMALANSGLGAVHGLAGVLGGWCGAPHGSLCGRLLPAVLEANAGIIAESGDQASNDRFHEVARWVCGSSKLGAMTDHLNRLLDLGSVPRLMDMGVARSELGKIAEASRLSSSMKGNPVALNNDDLITILERSY